MEQYQDSTLAPEVRAADLLRRMTLREKVGQADPTALRLCLLPPRGRSNRTNRGISGGSRPLRRPRGALRPPPRRPLVGPGLRDRSDGPAGSTGPQSGPALRAGALPAGNPGALQQRESPRSPGAGRLSAAGQSGLRLLLRAGAAGGGRRHLRPAAPGHGHRSGAGLGAGRAAGPALGPQ